MLLLKKAYRCHSEIGQSHARNGEKNGSYKFILVIFKTRNSDTNGHDH